MPGNAGIWAKHPESLMEHELTLDGSLSMTRAIKLVSQTLETDPDASRAILSRLFENERLSRFGGGEIDNLIQKINDIAKIDPSFVSEVFQKTFGYEIRGGSSGPAEPQPDSAADVQRCPRSSNGEIPPRRILSRLSRTTSGRCDDGLDRRRRELDRHEGRTVSVRQHG